MNGKIGFHDQPEYKGLEPASLLERYCAFFVDVVAVCVVGFIIFFVLSEFGYINFRNNGVISDEAGLIITAVVILSLFGYDGLFIPSIGRSLMGLKILYNNKDYNEYKERYRTAKKPIDWLSPRYLIMGRSMRPQPETIRALVRTLLIPLLPLSIIIALSNKEGKMIHDLCFDTVTVRESGPASKPFVEILAVFVTAGALICILLKLIIK